MKKTLIVLSTVSLLASSFLGAIDVVAVTSEHSESTQSTQKAETSKTKEQKSQSSTVEVSQSAKQLESTESQTESSTENTTDKQEENEFEPALFIPENLLNNPYFPTKPSKKDVEDASLLPGEIPLPDEGSIMGRASLSAKNTEIVKNSVAPITINYQGFNHYQPYADGLGKPRGIVIHETANPGSTIMNEINYMKNNWESAFVHAFVDQNNIIVVHPTDYLGWGAGPKANPYYMHVELVEHPNNRSAFYKSVNNDAYFAAYYLKRYNLKPSRAASNGTGTVWGHFEVSSFLGGTNHSDPVGYFNQFGYTFAEFYQLVEHHYSTLPGGIVTSESNISSDAVVTNPASYKVRPKADGTLDNPQLAMANAYNGQRVSVSKKAVTSTGIESYLFSVNGKEVGWVDKRALTLVDKIEYNKPVGYQAKILNETEATKHGIYTKPYNSDINIKEIGKGNLYANQLVDVIREAKTSRSTWFLFSINGKEIGWMDVRAFHKYDPITEPTNVSFNRKVKSTSTANIYDFIPNTQETVNIVGKTEDKQSRVFHVVKQARANKALWYYIQIDGADYGWLKASEAENPDTITFETSRVYNNVQLVQGSNQTIYNGIYTISPDIVSVGNSQNYQNQNLTITKTIVTSNGSWYYFTVGDTEIGWLQSQEFIIENQIKTSVYLKDKGWTDPAYGGMINGSTGNKENIIGLNIWLENSKNLSIEYAALVDGTWTKWLVGDKAKPYLSGAERIEAIRVRLVGTYKEDYDIYYRTHVSTFGWLGWTKNGESAGTNGYLKNLEAIELDVVKKGDKSPEETNEPYKEAPIGVIYKTHVQTKGWMPQVQNGEMSGTSGEAKRMEAIQLRVTNDSLAGNIEYSSHVQSIGWQSYVTDNKMSGTLGQSKRLEAIKIRLTGELANKYDIYYQVHAQKFGWLDWAKNGEESGTAGYGYRLEAIKIVLVAKGGVAPGKTGKPFALAPLKLSYSSHVQKKGWQPWVRENNLSGTSGEALRLEGFKLQIAESTKFTGTISYRTHVQKVGWQNYVSNGVLAGTQGRALRLEALQIKLTGELAQKYDVFYRVHSQSFGWLGWAKNDGLAGTYGLGKRMEAIQVVALQKGEVPQGYNTNAVSYAGGVDGSTAQGKFINAVAPHVRAVAPKNDLYSSVMIAQAALESGYGTSKLSLAPNYNLFGIKWNAGESGSYVEMLTLEDDGKGNMSQILAKFKKYPSYTGSFTDNANKLVNGVSWNKEYYKGTWKRNTKSYRDATAWLQGRYATDTSYASKLNSLIEKWKLTQFDY